MTQVRSTQTQERLLSTTADLMRRRGYHGAGLAEILAGSGVPKGSLYHHFPQGKAQLAAQSLHESGARIVRALRRLADEHGTVADTVRGFCDLYIHDLETTEYRRGCPLATVALESAELPDVVQQEVGATFAAMVDLLVQRINAERPSTRDPDGLATDIIASLEGALILAKAARSTAPLESVRDRLCARVTDEMAQE